MRGIRAIGESISPFDLAYRILPYTLARSQIAFATRRSCDSSSPRRRRISRGALLPIDRSSVSRECYGRLLVSAKTCIRLSYYSEFSEALDQFFFASP